MLLDLLLFNNQNLGTEKLNRVLIAPLLIHTGKLLAVRMLHLHEVGFSRLSWKPDGWLNERLERFGALVRVHKFLRTEHGPQFCALNHTRFKLCPRTDIEKVVHYTFGLRGQKESTQDPESKRTSYFQPSRPT